MKNYIIKFKSTKKYEPDIERTTIIKTSDLASAKSVFKRNFKEVEVLNIEEVEMNNEK